MSTTRWPDESQSPLYERVLDLGISAASRIHCPFPALTDIIPQSAHNFRAAREIFPTDEDLHQALSRRVSEMFAECVDKRVLLDADSPYLDRLRHYSEALKTFAAEQQAAFSAYCSLARTRELPDSFDADLTGVDSAFGLLLELVRDEIRREDGPEDTWLWLAISMTLYSGFWGIGHLNTFGIARHLLSVGKRQLCSSMLGHLYAATKDVIKTGRVCCPEPYPFANPETLRVPAAIDLPQNSPEEIRYALYRSAMEVIHQGGELSISAVARRIGLTSHDFHPFLDMDRPLQNQVEEFLNKSIHGVFLEQAALLPENVVPYFYGTMPGVAYSTIAVVDPLAFQVLSTIASGSIVPIKFDTELGDLEMGDALKALFTIVEKNIAIGGGSTDPWSLFESTVSLWAVVHGIAVLLSSGALSDLPESKRFDFLMAGVDISSAGLVSRLGLTLPGASGQCHQISK